MDLSKIIPSHSSQKIINNALPLSKNILSQCISKQYSITSISNKKLSNEKINTELKKCQQFKTIKANYNAKPFHQYLQI